MKKVLYSHKLQLELQIFSKINVQLCPFNPLYVLLPPSWYVSVGLSLLLLTNSKETFIHKKDKKQTLSVKITIFTQNKNNKASLRTVERCSRSKTFTISPKVYRKCTQIILCTFSNIYIIKL